MTKTEKQLSATQQIRLELPTILKTKYSKGATFDELWEELVKNKKLAKVMLNKDKEPRLGLLQGLSNRIKDGKEENIIIIKKYDGKNYFMYYDNTLDKQTKLTENYLYSIKNIIFDKETKFSKEKQELIKEQNTLLKKLEAVNLKLIS